MNLDDVEGIDVRALGGTDVVTVNDMGGTDLARVDVDLAGALGGSTADGKADTVTVAATKGQLFDRGGLGTALPSRSAVWPPSCGSPTRTPQATR